MSLLPSSTEITCAIGAAEALVGRSHECDFPAEVGALPALTRPRLDTHAASRAIDREVKQLVEQGLSIYQVDADRLRALAPDVILTQTLCEVCAVTPRDLEDAVRAWIGADPELVALAPNRLADVWGDIQRVGEALDRAARAEDLVTRLQRRAEQLATRARRSPKHPRVACVEWIDPLMAAGNWLPELVEAAGGVNLFGASGEHSPWLSWEQLREADPDVIVVLPCGFGLDRTRREMAPLVVQPDWEDLTAVRTGRVYLLEGNQFFNRPGPRLVDSLEILCEVLQPAVFDPRHQGSGWLVF